jgi:hypothetical protein
MVRGVERQVHLALFYCGIALTDDSDALEGGRSCKRFTTFLSAPLRR